MSENNSGDLLQIQVPLYISGVGIARSKDNFSEFLTSNRIRRKNKTGDKF